MQRGALVALEPLVPVESRITLRLCLGDASLSLRARVAWSTDCSKALPPEPGPVMGICFDDVDAEARGALFRFLTAQLQRFRL